MKYFKKTMILVSLFVVLFSCNQNNNKEESKTVTDSAAKKEIKDSSSLSAAAQTTVTEEKAVLDIRAEYDRISAAKLKQKKYAFQCDGHPGEGELIYYTENNNVVKVYVNWGVAGDFLRTSEYYYKEGKLFFIYETINGGAANEPQRTDEERTYISNNKTIRFMENKKILPCKTCEFNDNSLAYKVFKAFNTANATKVICD